nr:hypothetical protein [Tanacetum cinerariifolium]
MKIFDVMKVYTVAKHLDFMPSGATTLTKHVVKWRCIVLNVNNNGCGGCCCSNPSGGCGKPSGGRVTRGGEDGLEGPGSQLSMVVTYGSFGDTWSGGSS